MPLWCTIIASEPQQHWETAYLGLGANLGDREASLRSALQTLDALPTMEVTAVSSLYETAPVGITDQPPFLNAAAAVRTTLTPEGLLEAVLHLENEMGRARTQRWGPRVIDIDILAFGDRQVHAPALSVPHPRLWERAFALVPLAEIAPGLMLPGRNESIETRAKELRRNGNILSVNAIPGTP